MSVPRPGRQDPLCWGLNCSPGAGSMPCSWAWWPQWLEEVSGSAHRTCRTTAMSCRLPCRACRQRRPRVGTATCPWDTARQRYGATQRLLLARSQLTQWVQQLQEEMAQRVPAGRVAELQQLLEGEQRAAWRL
ncbi:uncharacterized protein [Muntiacus reevesi]|uniref:uncharacterized protein isoform X1 n=1 Tax=Muntiacus reevesi TaxID=9886 RepID=UPI003307400B